MTLSKERLAHYAAHTEGPVKSMARELLERRERDGQEPVAYMVGGYTLLHAHDPKVDEYLNRATPLYAAPPAPVVQVPEWTNEQCIEFLCTAFRHAEIKGDIEMDDIRLGVKMANSMLNGGQP